MVHALLVKSLVQLTVHRMFICVLVTLMTSDLLEPDKALTALSTSASQ
ncbi:hypothetical protein PA13076_11 [Salmonella phage vB_SenM_PA13076]|nr:hypothetical protein PA13076_11 [Salmonella phage vB_SenM_PA13076]